ncbi:MAG: helix-turn-helix domain-containing protein, partial [Gammaproteobacteria bacterium]|nr:helix-turn-helix domain-containing protein [Gammaproteobacteria bacterium]
AKGFTIISVAEQLHLDEQIVMAIESHQLYDLPEPAYVCGYIRNYARLLGVAPEPLIQQFKQEADLKSHLSSVNSIGNSLEKKQRINSYFFIIFLCIFFLGSLNYGWKTWIKPQNIELDVTTAEKTPNKLIEENKSNLTGSFVQETLSQSNKVDSDNLENIEENNNNNNSSQTDIQSEVINTGEVIDNINSIADTNLEVSEEVQIETPIIENNTEMENSEIPAEDKEIEAALKDLNTGKDERRLFLVFEKDSWISIKDARKKSLVYDLMRKGEQLNLNGKAPISVFLGDATGVTLTVDDKAYDLSSRINSKNIAKFTIE